TAQVTAAFKELKMKSPSGEISIDGSNNHTRLYCRIAKVDERGEAQVIYESPKPIDPKP
ncbi:MAG TPA: transcriptional regulator, partial [Ruminococcaceae bacterium]|nr:transcriptional regulator [Oscillospiraceae bacterium]